MKSTLKINQDGSFHVRHVTDLSYTYFPLCNIGGMKSSLAPNMGGDATINQNSFILLPSTVEDLSQSLLKRNVFFRIDDQLTWSITGQTPEQVLKPDEVDLYGDFLIHKIVRNYAKFTAVIESFVPSDQGFQEMHKVSIKNTSDKPLNLKPVVAVPIYGRSADSIRDHRHVTSLLNRIKIVENGMINHPTFSFDERGHLLNHRHYGVFSQSSHHQAVKYYYPTHEDFIGEGRTLLNPKVVEKTVVSSYRIGDTIAGYEAMAGMAYEEIALKPNETFSIVVTLIISDQEQSLIDQGSSIDEQAFDRLKQKTKMDWEDNLSSLVFKFGDSSFNGWLKWVTLQPILRRIYGNSFLPYHDYGRGGKGWRDLWQDLLALILMNPAPVREMLINNFKGVRIDGSNATIVGDKPGEFIADRNNIARIWMDHGSWPLLTTKLYIDQSGDLDLLWEKVSYFSDQFTHYTKQVKKTNIPKDSLLKTLQGDTYYGTVFEHLIVQNLVPYYNVGIHNTIRLEDADWNDGLDMAKENGESVSFTSFYGGNLVTLATLLAQIKERGINEIALFEEIKILLQPISHDDIATKKASLNTFFNTVENGISGKHEVYKISDLEKSLYEKGNALLEHVRQNEWLEEGEDGWFNGYYDNDSQPLDNIKKKHMTLTGQVFSIMSNAARDDQIEKIIQSADRYLYNPNVGGYRLNTDFKDVKTNMGRLFGFAYGHKENGAMFSHMAVMYANALYKRGFVKAGYKGIKTIYEHSIDLPFAKMYPGIPEYFDPKGRGMYPYLTGSASWLILTMITEVFGIKGDLGDTIIEPKLLLEQFNDKNTLSVKTVIGKRTATIVYHNPLHLDYHEYEIGEVFVNQEKVEFIKTKNGVKLKQNQVGQTIDIVLTTNKNNVRKPL